MIKSTLYLGLFGALVSTAGAKPRVDASGALIRDAASCGTTRTPNPVATVSTFADQPTRVIYLNRNGGTYNIVNGATNAATNTANTIAAGDNRQHMNAVIPPLEASYDWQYIVACVREQYKPFNIRVTETEPTSGNYVEAVVGGDGASTGWDASSGILGVASADNFCSVTEKGIAFSFSTNHLGISRANDELCATVAHEVGHLLSLEHEIAAKDTMSYVPFASSLAKSFTNANSHCGTDSSDQIDCSCQTTGSGQQTNSYVRLTQFLGLRPVETVPPTLTVTSPGDGNVRPSFQVIAEASDETLMDHVEVLIDGLVLASSADPTGTTYSFDIANVRLGDRTLEVDAYDLAGNVTKKTIPLVVALGATGDTCTAGADCTGAQCIAVEGNEGKFCSQTCDASNACPSGFDCAEAGSKSVCVPSSDDGGCSTGGSGPTALMGLGLLGAVAMLGSRRRR